MRNVLSTKATIQYLYCFVAFITRRNKVATYIRKEIAKYARVSMKIDFNKFSDRQIKNIIKQLRNGAVSYGNSATATVAKWLLKKYPMPHFRYDSR